MKYANIATIIDYNTKNGNKNSNDAFTPIRSFAACSCGHSEVVSLLVRKGADSSLKDEDGVDCADDVQRILKHLSDRNEDTSWTFPHSRDFHLRIDNHEK